MKTICFGLIVCILSAELSRTSAYLPKRTFCTTPLVSEHHRPPTMTDMNQTHVMRKGNSLRKDSVGSRNKYNRRNSIYDSEQKLIDALRSAKRTNWNIELCGRYDDWCKPGSENPTLVCCSGYRCKCSLWNSTCRCRTTIFGGR